VDSFGNALNIFISTMLRLLYFRLSHFSALTFANASIDTEFTSQNDALIYDKECELMKLRSVSICRPGVLPKITCWIFGNPKKVSGWRYFSLFFCQVYTF
jgi:hypothetical protein